MAYYIQDGFFNYLVLFIFLAGMEWLICQNYKKNHIKISRGFVIGWQVFACLLIGIFTVTGTAQIREVIQGNGTIGLDKINLIPFRWGLEGIRDYFGLTMNVVMFVPVGFLLPLLWEDCRKFLRTTLLGASFSIMIEISQLFNFRATDVEDVIMNTLGTMAGYGLFYIWGRENEQMGVNNRQGGWVVKNSAALTIFGIMTFYFVAGGPLIYWVHTFM